MRGRTYRAGVTQLVFGVGLLVAPMLFAWVHRFTTAITKTPPDSADFSVLLAGAQIVAGLALIWTWATHKIRTTPAGIKGYDWMGRLVFSADWSELRRIEEHPGTGSSPRHVLFTDDDALNLDVSPKEMGALVSEITQRAPHLTVSDQQGA